MYLLLKKEQKNNNIFNNPNELDIFESIYREEIILLESNESNINFNSILLKKIWKDYEKKNINSIFIHIYI